MKKCPLYPGLSLVYNIILKLYSYKLIEWISASNVYQTLIGGLWHLLLLLWNNEEEKFREFLKYKLFETIIFNGNIFLW